MKITKSDHLTGLSEVNHLVDVCCYLDGIELNSNFVDLVNLINNFFESYGKDVQQIVIKLEENSRPRVFSRSTFSKYVKSEDFINKGDIESIQCFPSFRKNIDETWRPEIYFGADYKSRVRSMFFSVRSSLGCFDINNFVDEISDISKFCVAYLFHFPVSLSSLAYYWGIEMMSSRGENFRYKSEKSRRLENWRRLIDLSQTSYESSKLIHPSSGYVRDVYPIMIFKKSVIKKNKELSILLKKLENSRIALPEDGFYTIKYEFDQSRIHDIQNLFDISGLTLSNRSS